MAEYIDREAAIEAAIDAADEWDGGYNANRAAQIREGINYIPAADVRPVVRGRWVPVTNGRGGHECNLCHDYAPSFQSGAEYTSPHCPNCGADMREG